MKGKRKWLIVGVAAIAAAVDTAAGAGLLPEGLRGVAALLLQLAAAL